MEHLNNAPVSGSRAAKGTLILERAKVVNTRPVKAPLETFAATHRVFCDAQGVVDRAREALRAQKQNVALLDDNQDKALAILAAQLVADGAPHNNPFRPFGVESLARLQAKPYGAEAQAIYALVGLVQNDTATSPAARDAARAAGAAAAKVQDGLERCEGLAAALEVARQQRDAIAKAWEADRRSLLHNCIAASTSEAPGLYEALFQRTSVKRGKASTEPAAAPPDAPPPPEPGPLPAPSLPSA